MSGFVALALHSALAAKTDAAATQQVKQKEFDTPQQAADSLVQAAASFDVPVLKEILGPESTDLVSSTRSGRGQKSGGRICCEGEREEFSCHGCEESEPRCSHDWKRRFSFSDSNREAKGQVVLRYQGGPSGNSESACRRQRTGRDCHLPWFRRSAAGICSAKARRFQGEPVRAANHQHAWET